jgi:hypothetical protein
MSITITFTPTSLNFGTVVAPNTGSITLSIKAKDSSLPTSMSIRLRATLGATCPTQFTLAPDATWTVITANTCALSPTVTIGPFSVSATVTLPIHFHDTTGSGFKAGNITVQAETTSGTPLPTSNTTTLQGTMA